MRVHATRGHVTTEEAASGGYQTRFPATEIERKHLENKAFFLNARDNNDQKASGIVKGARQKSGTPHNLIQLFPDGIGDACALHLVVTFSSPPF